MIHDYSLAELNWTILFIGGILARRKCVARYYEAKLGARETKGWPLRTILMAGLYAQLWITAWKLCCSRKFGQNKFEANTFRFRGKENRSSPFWNWNPCVSKNEGKLLLYLFSISFKIWEERRFDPVVSVVRSVSSFYTIYLCVLFD